MIHQTSLPTYADSIQAGTIFQALLLRLTTTHDAIAIVGMNESITKIEQGTGKRMRISEDGEKMGMNKDDFRDRRDRKDRDPNEQND